MNPVELPEQIWVSEGMNISRDPAYSVEKPAPVEDEERIKTATEYVRGDLVESRRGEE